MKDSVATDHSRRNLVLAIGAGSVGAAALANPALNLATSAKGGPASNWWNRLFVSLAQGSAEEWSAIRGQVFSVMGEKGKVQLMLSEVKLLTSKGVRPREVTRQRAFALVFLAPPNTAPEGQRSYRLTHATYPPLDVYLDPANRLAKGVRLTAVFN